MHYSLFEIFQLVCNCLIIILGLSYSMIVLVKIRRSTPRIGQKKLLIQSGLAILLMLESCGLAAIIVINFTVVMTTWAILILVPILLCVLMLCSFMGLIIMRWINDRSQAQKIA